RTQEVRQGEGPPQLPVLQALSPDLSVYDKRGVPAGRPFFFAVYRKQPEKGGRVLGGRHGYWRACRVSVGCGGSSCFTSARDIAPLAFACCSGKSFSHRTHRDWV